MKTSSAKQKGRKLQQYIRDRILGCYSELTDRDVRSTSMGAGGEDVTLSKKAVRIFPYAVECKSKAKFVGYSYYDQAVEHSLDSHENVEPVAFIKANHRQPLAIVDAGYFIELTRKVYDRRQGQREETQEENEEDKAI